MLIVTDAVVAVEAPLHPVNVYPCAAVAVTVTVAPELYLLSLLFGLRVTVPPPCGETFVVSVNVLGWKLAVSVRLPFIVTVTLAFVEVDAPLHPVNVYPCAAVAVTVTDVPEL
jgi:hypothetical protein